jgi:hypothetical protein
MPTAYLIQLSNRGGNQANEFVFTILEFTLMGCEGSLTFGNPLDLNQDSDVRHTMDTIGAQHT